MFATESTFQQATRDDRNVTPIAPSKLNPDELREAIERLPPLPQSTTQIISVLSDPLFEISELIRVVSLDPGLTGNLLRLANSAESSVARPACSVGEAIVRLGSGTVLALSLAARCRPPAQIDLTPFGLTVEEYWMHCVASVAAADELNSRRIARFGAGFGAAAVLHDFGKQILAEYLTSEHLIQMSAYHRLHPGRSHIDAERFVLGVDHAHIGAAVARVWNLSDDIVRSIRNHHSVSNWDDDIGNGIIIANQVAHDLLSSNHGPLADDSELVADAMMALGVEEKTYISTVDGASKRFGQLIELFGL